MEHSNIVRVWEEDVIIPTYGVGKPEKNPIFLENRVYQGSSGVVYPHPVIEKILDEKSDKKYHALFLENKYLKIMILPALGGRVQMAYDKVKQRHFIYYNRVIKPALVGLTGPWISGGIEFNWPQHHRPSTFDPIDYAIEEHPDGSKTVWVSEVERMFRTKGMAGFRLYPDKAYLEINAKLYNRTPFAQTFLWWANPAVKVNDDYQSVFPPDVHAVFDHGKRDVSEFPIARGTYYKVDYSAGVDISRYKNIPVPTSYMAIKSKYDFMGGYEHDTKGGLLHVANHHVSPGKKQWTWGNGEFGRAWDRNLTDEDGPYIELMTGVFTDNQPDFSWIHPFEERTFTQYFMPYSEIGIVKNATKDGMINVEFGDREILIKLYTTSEYKSATLCVQHHGKALWEDKFTVSPETPVVRTIPVTAGYKAGEVAIALSSSEGRVIVSYQADPPEAKEVPEPAQPARDPAEIPSIEQLFLTGQHIEQYRHATYKATDYYEEALRLEPSDIRCNNAMGLWYLKRGKFEKSIPYFSAAIKTLTQRNPNPYDGEPLFNLGLACFMLGRYDDAYEAFYKSSWSAAWQDAAYLHLARIASKRHNFEEALELIEKSLNRNYTSHTARHLKVIALRKLRRTADAMKLVEESLKLDRFNFGCLFEKYLMSPDWLETETSRQVLTSFITLIRGNQETYFEYAFDYIHAGCFEEASTLLNILVHHEANEYPLTYYYLGFLELQKENRDKAMAYFKTASSQKPDYCFPNRIEDVLVLESAMRHNEDDSFAPYYLGNFWYGHRQYADAIACWERSASINDAFPTVHRNLALAYHNKRKEFDKARASLEKAFSLDTRDARVLMELDQLYKKLNKSHRDRLAILEQHRDLTEERDDLYLERITLYNHLGRYKEAKRLLASRKFHPWEGGEGKVVGQHLIANLELAKESLERHDYENALELLSDAEKYPENFGEGKLHGAQENDIHFLRGCAYEGIGNQEEAERWLASATQGLDTPVQAIYYNDQQPDKIFYQGLAWRKLGNLRQAEQIFRRLVEFGEAHMNDKIKIDYFAVSLPDLLVFDQDLDQRNRNHCNYLIGLGCLGLGTGFIGKAIDHFKEVLKHDLNHFGAEVHLKMAEKSLSSLTKRDKGRKN